MRIASDCNELSVPSPCTNAQNRFHKGWYGRMYACTHTHTHTIGKPAHTSTHSKNFSPMYTYFLSSITYQPSIAMLSGSCNYYLYTHKPNTYICTYMYACTHVHTQRCSVLDHSRVIIELENVYVMVDQMLCTSLMMIFKTVHKF